MDLIIFQCLLILLPLNIKVSAAKSIEHKDNAPRIRQDKRSVILGDLSYSYSATDIESAKGSHIKTITVIKNVAAPKTHHHGNDEHAKEWNKNFKFFVKVPDVPDISDLDFFNSKSGKRHKDRGGSDGKNKSDKGMEEEEEAKKMEEKNPEPQPKPDMVPVYENTNESDGLKPAEALPEAMSLKKNENTDPVPKDVEIFQLEPASPATATKIDDSQSRYSVHKQKTPPSSSSDSHRPVFVEDFSEFSMRNVKQLNIPKKSYDHSHHTRIQGGNQQTKSADQSKKQQFQNFGIKMEQSQSYIDLSNQDLYPQRIKPYVAPSVAAAGSSTTPKSVRGSSTSSIKLQNSFYPSTSQKPYMVPFGNKPKVGQNQPVSYNLQRPSDASYSVNRTPPPSTMYKGYKIGSSSRSLSLKEPNIDLSDQKNNKKQQSYVAVPLDSSTSSPSKDSDSSYNNKNTYPLPAHLERHTLVFKSKPPHAFLASPFQSASLKSPFDI